eukprot:GHVR01155214.1.p1 GENE.GHVR01155214.1~~GHVR01155214.1.p1  ORF type:complete len:327 (-),score=15.71 GHVR01155214.1:150-1130(-)
MKVLRNKKFRRTMRFYRVNFGLHEPFRVLIDGPFIQACLKHRIHIKEQLPLIFGGKCTPMVTNCVLNELRKLGPGLSGAALIAKGFYRLKCGHDHEGSQSSMKHDHSSLQIDVLEGDSLRPMSVLELQKRQEREQRRCDEMDKVQQSEDDAECDTNEKPQCSEKRDKPESGDTQLSNRPISKNKPLNGGTCILRNIGWGNPKKLCVATQDRPLQEKLRVIPGTPLVYLRSQVPVLEEPSPVSLAAQRKSGRVKALPKDWEKRFLPESTAKPPPKPQRKKRGLKEPNPLSQKKKSKPVKLKGAGEKPRRVRTKRHDSAITGLAQNQQ